MSKSKMQRFSTGIYGLTSRNFDGEVIVLKIIK